MTPPFEVLWDGRRGGPGGAQLMTDEPERRLPERGDQPLGLAGWPPKASKPMRMVRALLEQRPMTMNELAQASSIHPHHINAVLYTMRQQGAVVIVGTSSGHAGRPGAKVYGLVGAAYIVATNPEP